MVIDRLIFRISALMLISVDTTLTTTSERSQLAILKHRRGSNPFTVLLQVVEQELTQVRDGCLLFLQLFSMSTACSALPYMRESARPRFAEHCVRGNL